jgi:hypothetical protein
MDSQNISSEESDKNQAANEKKAGKRPTKQRKRKLTSLVWNHFEEVFVDGERKGKCNYCGKLICADGIKNGTSAMGRHTKRCELYPPNLEDQKSLYMKKMIWVRGGVVVP